MFHPIQCSFKSAGGIACLPRSNCHVSLLPRVQGTRALSSSVACRAKARNKHAHVSVPPTPEPAAQQSRGPFAGDNLLVAVATIGGLTAFALAQLVRSSWNNDQQKASTLGSASALVESNNAVNPAAGLGAATKADMPNLEGARRSLEQQLQQDTQDDNKRGAVLQELQSAVQEAQQAAQALEQTRQGFQSLLSEQESVLVSSTSTTAAHIEEHHGSLAKFRSKVLELEGQLAKADKAKRSESSVQTLQQQLASAEAQVAAAEAAADELDSQLHLLQSAQEQLKLYTESLWQESGEAVQQVYQVVTQGTPSVDVSALQQFKETVIEAQRTAADKQAQLTAAQQGLVELVSSINPSIKSNDAAANAATSTADELQLQEAATLAAAAAVEGTIQDVVAEVQQATETAVAAPAAAEVVSAGVGSVANKLQSQEAATLAVTAAVEAAIEDVQQAAAEVPTAAAAAEDGVDVVEILQAQEAAAVTVAAAVEQATENFTPDAQAAEVSTIEATAGNQAETAAATAAAQTAAMDLALEIAQAEAEAAAASGSSSNVKVLKHPTSSDSSAAAVVFVDTSDATARGGLDKPGVDRGSNGGNSSNGATGNSKGTSSSSGPSAPHSSGSTTSSSSTSASRAPAAAVTTVAVAEPATAATTVTDSPTKPSRVGQLRIQAAGVVIPHPEKADTGGEDDYFVSSVGCGCFGIADGVGGWSSEGIDSAAYARGIMAVVSDAYATSNGEKGPTELLQYAQDKTVGIPGSCTALVARLKPDCMLEVLSLGDSGVRIIRGDEGIVFASEVQEHDYNLPYQMASLELLPNADTPDMALTYNVPLQPGDVIVAGSDGLFDNMWDNKLADLVHASLK
eukprot:GHRR01009870.1.p1 GENE.GHRR01009870.1~~GHRR01009870.1.p1  ORF type:complete len:856 (+),score=402.70 GHRR01009870.1:178-2745(+)